MSTSAATVPICVDLDGTLIRTDMLYESLLAALRRRPWLAFVFPFWLLSGKAGFKRRVAEQAGVDPALLPYREGLLDWLREQRRAGRRLLLVTATHQILAEPIARHLQLFDEVVASNGCLNLAGRDKRAYLVERFGEKGFDYCGNSRADLAVWDGSRTALLVNAPAAVEEKARRVAEVSQVFPAEPGGLLPWLRALRLHQWSKNLLIFVPLITSHTILDPVAARSGALMFLAFSLCASAGYLINDLLDLEADRRHPLKRSRPFASGALSIATGLGTAPILLLAGFAITALLPTSTAAVLAAYLSGALLYSLFIKRQVLLDVFVLSALYNLRIVAGHQATGIAYSPWLLSFATFLFLSLALSKRVSELHNQGAAAGRGYVAGDRAQLNVFGVCSGFLASLVLALYISSDAVAALYRRPLLLWMLCPLLLYWISRVWILAHRGHMDEDPIAFAVRDPATYAIGAAGLLILILASKVAGA